ncbi:UNVERIFIED_CONTAM: hypothetical protein HDU68_010221 [Siphonaria sp. JEL0065]|nr:hypothetical protein HDU68_010221 [Siphonaria sp. JEL0065]
MEDLKPDKGIVKNLVQRGCPNFDLLCKLFENNLVTGHFAAASTQADQNDLNESEPDNENFEESDPNPSTFTTGPVQLHQHLGCLYYSILFVWW